MKVINIFTWLIPIVFGGISLISCEGRRDDVIIKTEGENCIEQTTSNLYVFFEEGFQKDSVHFYIDDEISFSNLLQTPMNGLSMRKTFIDGLKKEEFGVQVNDKLFSPIPIKPSFPIIRINFDSLEKKVICIYSCEIPQYL